MRAEGRGKTGQRVKKGQVVARLSGAALRENILHCRAKLEKAFLRYAGVAAVYIIYRYRGNGGQRVADKTLVGVGQLQVVLGVGVSNAQTHLQPALQLSVQIENRLINCRKI